nr:unnamed protein product [Spirometra erinaceieuropaei]
MPLSCSSLVDVPFRLGSSEFTHPFYVCPDIQWQGILGADFLYANRFCVDFAAGQLTSKSTTIPFYFPHAPDPQLLCDSVGLHPPQPSDLVHLVPDSPGFSSEQITAVRNLIFKNSAAFAWDGEPLGRTNVLQHTIDTGSARPIRQPPRRVPVHFQKQLEQTIKDMLDKHVIRPSSSPWASPIVLVKKKDGSLRLCVDYRKLNAVTVKDSFPLPRIDTTLEALAGAACFSTLDLQSAYWQVEMAPEDRHKTAFSMPSGLYEFETMPFGLANAPDTFQRLMASVLRDLCPTACLVYLDDVIVHGSTVESHLDNLQTVFNRLQAIGHKLNPAKCCFLKKSLPFLGHIVSTEGVKTDPSKTESKYAVGRNRQALCILRASDDPDGPTFAAHFNKLKPYALDDDSCGPVSSELPSFPSAELPHPPTDPSSIVSVPTSPPAPAVPTSPTLPSPLPR